jgi:cytidylate kinase
MTVEAAADQGHVVIIGRGSQVMLAARRDVLHVRVVAPLDRRIAYVSRREGITSEEAGLRIRWKDRDRRNYLRAEYHQVTDDPLLYDLSINTAVLNLDSAVDLILLALEAKSTMLRLPEEELGPAAGQSRYPGKPLDLQTPFIEPSPP